LAAEAGGLIESRPYEGAADLRRMQRLVQDVWAVRGEKSAHHVGDLAWQRFQHVGRDPSWRTQLWQEGEHVTAYGWVLEDDVLDFCVHPEHPELLDDVLAWAGAHETEVLDEDIHAIATLERCGYARAEADAPFFEFMKRELDELPDAPVPDGFVLRTVDLADIDGRVTAHRSAFNPSRVTVESYRNVMQTWPYRDDLDCVAVAPDGRIAAYCLAWLDDENRVGELEPVGTHADFRRLGLAAAVCAFALRRLSDEGSNLGIVYSRGDAAYHAPKLLYESIGFRAHARTITFRRD
jgi:ribosomal protein S18 acetylase RimI-like enzyme